MIRYVIGAALLRKLGESLELGAAIFAGLSELLGDSFGDGPGARKWAHERWADHGEIDEEGLAKWQELLRAAPGRIGVWTSGTTGQQQFVEHCATSLLRGIQGGAKHRADVWGLTYAPGSYAFWQVVLQALYNRNPVVDLYRIGSSETLGRIIENCVTHLSGTPTFFRRLDEAGPPCPTVQAVTVGGEILDTRALAAIQRQFPKAKIRNVYASTQAGVLLTSDTDIFTIPIHRRAELTVVDGQLLVNASLLGQGVQTMESGPSAFYPTGDLVEIVDGAPDDITSPLRFRFVGRQSAVIHVGGLKVSPEAVEAAIQKWIPEVQNTRVYGVANSVTGQIVACEVVLAADVTALDIGNFRQRLAQELPAAAIPRIVEIVPQIETTDSGKIRRSNG